MIFSTQKLQEEPFFVQMLQQAAAGRPRAKPPSPADFRQPLRCALLPQPPLVPDSALPFLPAGTQPLSVRGSRLSPLRSERGPGFLRCYLPPFQPRLLQPVLLERLCRRRAAPFSSALPLRAPAWHQCHSLRLRWPPARGAAGAPGPVRWQSRPFCSLLLLCEESHRVLCPFVTCGHSPGYCSE